MRIVAVLLASIALTLLIITPSLAQNATSYESTEVVPGIHMLQGVGGFGGGNVGLIVGEEKIVLIDGTMPPTAPMILELAEKIAGRPADFVINTHVHGDHVGGNALLAETGALVVAHENIRKRLLEDAGPAGGEAGLPVITFSDEVTFHVNGLEIRVFHVHRAHTDGDGAIHFPDVNVIHAGDLMFHQMFPFIDLDTGGSVDGYIAAQKHLIEMCDESTIIIPGHGALATRSDLQEELDVLLDSLARVRRLVEMGKTADEIVKKNPLAEYHDGWNWGFITTERMTRTLVRSLTEGS